MPCSRVPAGALVVQEGSVSTHFTPAFQSASSAMYSCSNCGRVLTSQQNLNYHLIHKPKTCEKYLRKLVNQQKKSAMAITAEASTKVAISLSLETKIVGNDVSVSTSRLPKVSSQVAAVSPSLATKTVGNDVSVSTSSLTKRSCQVARVIAPTQATVASLSLAAKSAGLKVTSLASPVVPTPSEQPVRTLSSDNNLLSLQKKQCR